MTGPYPGVFIFNITLTFAVMGIFYAFVAYRLHPSVIAGGFVLHGISLYFLLRSAFTDPGVMARNHSPIEGEPPTHMVNGRREQLKYCNTCHIFRPPKCKHCRICDNCVEAFDHHCPWVMNCVGKRNYRYFVGFVASISILSIYVCACSIALLVETAIYGDSLPTGPVLVSIVLIILTGCLGCTLSGFAMFHCRLIAQGVTTNEYLKGRAGPVNEKGCVGNCIDIYCTALPQPNIDLRGPLYEEKNRGGSEQKMMGVNDANGDNRVSNDVEIGAS